jgi:hypothetical protein
VEAFIPRRASHALFLDIGPTFYAARLKVRELGHERHQIGECRGFEVQAAIIALFRVLNRNFGNVPPR